MIEDRAASAATTSHLQDLKEDQSEMSLEKHNGTPTAKDKSDKEGDAANPTDDDIVYPTGLKIVLVLLALCLSVFLVALDQTIIR